MTNDAQGPLFCSWIGPYLLGPSFATALSLLAFVGILLLLGIGIRQKAKRRPCRGLGWWSERIGICALLVNTLILARALAVVLWTLCTGHYGQAEKSILSLESCGFARSFSYACGVALAGFMVSMVLRWLEQSKGTSQPPPAN